MKTGLVSARKGLNERAGQIGHRRAIRAKATIVASMEETLHFALEPRNIVHKHSEGKGVGATRRFHPAKGISPVVHGR